MLLWSTRQICESLMGPLPRCSAPQILSLPCGHEFHADCVTQWLRFKGAAATCPNCKHAVFGTAAATAHA